MSEKEKQIEEMAKLRCLEYGENCYKNCIRQGSCYVEEECRALYKAGYRKQSESEWIVKRETDTDFYTSHAVAHCKNCGEQMWYKSIVVLKKYCPECGAKMKNATERSKQ